MENRVEGSDLESTEKRSEGVRTKYANRESPWSIFCPSRPVFATTQPIAIIDAMTAKPVITPATSLQASLGDGDYWAEVAVITSSAPAVMSAKESGIASATAFCALKPLQCMGETSLSSLATNSVTVRSIFS